MAPIRSIRRRGQQLMALTIGARKVIDSCGLWLEFPSVEEAVAYLRSRRCEPDGRLSPSIVGDGQGQALPPIAPPEPA